MAKKSTREEFIKKSLLKHGDRYDYSLVEYVKSDIKVKIVCKEHGIFEQHPYAHVNGNGCKQCHKCCNSGTQTTEGFIKKAKLKHGDKYDYSLTEYVNYHTKVKIICKEHGVFERTPTVHLSGYGCIKCSKLSGFIRNSLLKHGDRYDYSLTEYVNYHTKVKIICKEHGVFKQTPKVHINTNGCRKCSSGALTKDEFVVGSVLKHGDRYDYSLVEYVNRKTKVKITCPHHGVFEQRPPSHLNGYGCRRCTKKN